MYGMASRCRNLRNHVHPSLPLKNQFLVIAHVRRSPSGDRVDRVSKWENEMLRDVCGCCKSEQLKERKEVGQMVRSSQAPRLAARPIHVEPPERML